MAGPDEAQKGHARRSDVGDDGPNGRIVYGSPGRVWEREGRRILLSKKTQTMKREGE